jgi:hypothetical protein
LLDDPPVHEGEPVDLDTLDQDEFAAQGIVGVPEAQVVSVASATDDEREATQRQLDYWMGTVCRPWSLRWLDVERSRSFYKQLFDPRTRADRDRDVSERVWVSAVLGGNPILTAERQLSSTTRSCSWPSSSLSLSLLTPAPRCSAWHWYLARDRIGLRDRPAGLAGQGRAGVEAMAIIVRGRRPAHIFLMVGNDMAGRDMTSESAF